MHRGLILLHRFLTQLSYLAVAQRDTIIAPASIFLLLYFSLLALTNLSIPQRMFRSFLFLYNPVTPASDPSIMCIASLFYKTVLISPLLPSCTHKLLASLSLLPASISPIHSHSFPLSKLPSSSLDPTHASPLSARSTVVQSDSLPDRKALHAHILSPPSRRHCFSS